MKGSINDISGAGFRATYSWIHTTVLRSGRWAPGVGASECIQTKGLDPLGNFPRRFMTFSDAALCEWAFKLDVRYPVRGILDFWPMTDEFRHG